MRNAIGEANNDIKMLSMGYWHERFRDVRIAIENTLGLIQNIPFRYKYISSVTKIWSRTIYLSRWFSLKIVQNRYIDRKVSRVTGRNENSSPKSDLVTCKIYCKYKLRFKALARTNAIIGFILALNFLNHKIYTIESMWNFSRVFIKCLLK